MGDDRMKKQGETQEGLGYTPAEQLPGSTFRVIGNPEEHEAVAFTGTARRRPAGFIDYNPQEKAIGTVFVSPQFRGKGIADRLYSAAGSPAHSTRLTEQGERFARRVGGAMPASESIEREPPMKVGPASVKAIVKSIHESIQQSLWDD